MEKTMIRHLLLCKFAPEMTAAQFEEFIRAFGALKEKIEGILAFEYGENNSSEGLDQGMTHVIVLTFVDAAARDAYLVHPEHVRFAKWFGGLSFLQALVVVDYVPS